MKNITGISPDAEKAIRLLKKKEYKAYLAGGCVRDLLLGKLPADWDITTSALPEETKAVFEEEGFRTFDTGIKHGTVSVLFGREILEITTFRAESGYSDGRHPDEVTFIRSAEEDVKRRDFTMNALLLDPDEGIIDYVGGQADIKAGIIRCVGDPNERFSEDALRIMRQSVSIPSWVSGWTPPHRRPCFPAGNGFWQYRRNAFRPNWIRC